jgi:hypothetical protein
VSLNISNAFNSLPWSCIGRALECHEVPGYLRAVLREYLSERSIGYVNAEAIPCQKRMVSGVPQGSVLGPLLWNLAYDEILRSALPPGSSVVCYADDTMVIAGGVDYEEAIAVTNDAVNVVVRQIRRLGLTVAAQKTEMVFFADRRRHGEPPKNARIMVSGNPVNGGSSMKYLGLHIDGEWKFEEHFSRLPPSYREWLTRWVGYCPILVARVAGCVGFTRAWCTR